MKCHEFTQKKITLTYRSILQKVKEGEKRIVAANAKIQGRKKQITKTCSALVYREKDR